MYVRKSPDIRGFIRGNREDKISLYADDALLYLGDTQRSLSSLIQLLDRFGSFSGLTINWDKSVLLPLDTSSCELPVCADKLAVVQQFKYLGIWITRDVLSYIKLNLKPLLLKFKQKCTAWCKLPLSVVGRANLVKMIWAPQMLYVLHNSPIWIPQKYFRQIDGQYRTLIWKGKSPRIALSHLQLPKDGGGLAVPHSKCYFLAAQLQHIVGWSEIDWTDPIQALLLSQMCSYPLLHQLEAGSILGGLRCPTATMWSRLWNLIRAAVSFPQILFITPIWYNNNLGELGKLEAAQHWISHGVQYVSQLYSAGTLKSFSELQLEFSIPTNMFYRYLQLRHALLAQWRDLSVSFTSLPVLSFLSCSGNGRRGLISRLYAHMLVKMVPTSHTKVIQGWESDVGEISAEDWEAALMNIKVVSLSQSQRLTQLFILYRAYRTPQKLFKWGLRDNAECPRCRHSPADFIHMFWRCPKLFRYWQEILNHINAAYRLHLTSSPILCLLNPLDEEVYPIETLQPVVRLLYQARKLIALKWLSPNPPSVAEWRQRIGSSLARERLVFLNRGCPQKFDKLWKPWLESGGS